MENVIEKTCCFTGHRPEKLNISEIQAKALLKEEILLSISEGYTTFISGMARGVDLWGAEIVLEQKKENSQIKLICAIPFEGFEKSWSVADKNSFRFILSKCDYKEFICPHYTPSCFQIRNIWMVNRSSKVIAMYNGLSGGTKNTINYARKNDVAVKNIING